MTSTRELPKTGSGLKQKAHMLLVLRSKPGIFALHLLELLVSDSGTLAMKKLWERLDREGALKSRTKLNLRMSVEVAEINLVGDSPGPSLILVLTRSTVAVTQSRNRPMFGHCPCQLSSDTRALHSCSS